MTAFATRRWRAIGTACSVVAQCGDRPSADLLADRAQRLAVIRLDELDRAASRFRADSELSRLTRGTTVRVSAMLNGALGAALRTARLTDGLVDPTVGSAVRDNGYDADIDIVRARDDRPDAATPAPAPGYRRIRHDPVRALVQVPRGVQLDLGASAKAWLADHIAAELCAGSVIPQGAGVVVNLGGDVAAAGIAPASGWQIGVDDGSDRRRVVGITDGGVATSSTVLRSWRQGGEHRHHIVDPRSGRTAPGDWRTVSVKARSCELANAASTAAVVLGRQAPGWLGVRGLHARLCSAHGAVVVTGGWPREPGHE